MPVYFENVPITIGGSGISATSLSANDAISLESHRAYGGGIFSYNSSSIQGNINISFNWVDDLLPLFTGLKKSNYATTLGIGSSTGSGYMTSFTLVVQATEPVTADVSFFTTTPIDFSAAPPSGKMVSGALGAKSEVGEGDATSITYTITQNYNTQNLLGSLNTVTSWTDGEETLSVEGFTLIDPSITTNFCPSLATQDLVLKDCLGTTLGSIAITGYRESRDFSVAPNGFVESSYEFKKFF